MQRPTRSTRSRSRFDYVKMLDDNFAMRQFMPLGVMIEAELEGALRAQAELDNINNKLYASFDEEVPEEYRDLVQEYYRVLSEGQGSDSPRQ